MLDMGNDYAVCDDNEYLDLGDADNSGTDGETLPEQITIYQTTIAGADGENFTTDKYFDEFCLYCAADVKLLNIYVPQPCPNCLEILLPCARCNHQDCENCPLKSVAETMGAQKPKRGTEDDYSLRVFGINSRLKRLIDSLKASDDHTDYTWDELIRMSKRLGFD